MPFTSRLVRFFSTSEPRIAARRAALFFLASSLIAFAGALLLAPNAAQRASLLLVGLLDIACAAVLWVLPWSRWPSSALAVIAPLGMLVIGAVRVQVGTPLHIYSAFYMLLAIWIGLSLPPRASLALAPLTLVGCALPLWLSGPANEAVGTALTIVPLCVVVGEVLADVMQQIQRAQALLEQQVAERTAELRISNAALSAQVAEHASAARALVAAEAKYRTLVEQIPAVVYTAEIDATSSTQYVNPQVEQILGFTPQEWLADPDLWLKQVHPDDLATVLATVQRVHQDDALQSSEFRSYTRDGRLIWLRDMARVVRDDAGRALFMQGIALDITDRKQAEEALLAERALLERRVAERTADLRAANAELARAARLKDEFLANMSHELRTPLNAVLGFGEALREHVYGEVSPQQDRALRMIEESGRHLLELINDILDLAKVGAGRIELLREPCEVEPLCRSSQRMVQQAALKKQITIEVAVDPRAAVVVADVRRMKQVLVNLLSNAVKFTAVGGSVGLEVTCDPADELIQFAVWDTGIGIAEEHLSQLFQPFVQLDSRLARQYEGTGLGLALVARLVALHNGGVTVQSALGAGSRFTVALPWQPALTQPEEAEQPGAPPSTPQPAPAERPTILLAEDNELSSAAIMGALDRLGYEVVLAHDGEEALALARSALPAAVLMDVQVPGMSGLEVMQRMRAIAELAATPILALSALAMPGDDERCRAAGATAFLNKPLSTRALRQALAAAQERQQISPT